MPRYTDEFNKHYTITGNDPIYIRYLLTQSMMDRLVDLKNYLGIALRIKFINDTILI